jgi:hypothetical protein
VSSKRNLMWLATAALGMTVVGAAIAQTATSPKVVITNLTPNVEIPLTQSSTVEIDASGDLRIQCRTVNGVCPGLSQTGPIDPNGPTGLALAPSTTNLFVNGAFSLAWASGTGTESCYGAGPAGISNWTGQSLATSGTRNLSLPEGSHIFQLRCFNSAGSATISSAVVTVAPNPGPGPAEPYCQEHYGAGLPTSPNFTAFGFQRVDVAFEEIWGVAPGQTSLRRALPGNFLRPSAGRYLAIPFTMTASEGSGTQFTFGAIEASSLEGVATGSVSASISPCPGDFRPRASSTDIYLSHQCRNSFQNALQFNLTVTSITGQSGCLAPPGKVMYLNLATYDMWGPTAPTSTTCGTNETCGVSMRLN